MSQRILSINDVKANSCTYKGSNAKGDETMTNQPMSPVHTFRYWLSTLTFTEISIYVVMLVTFIGGLASIFF